MSKADQTSVRAESIISTFDCEDFSVEKSDTVGKPRMGLGSTANENIALRRNFREMEQLWRKQKILGEEQEWVMKLIDLYSKAVQVNYRRLTKRVSRIKSHLTEDEIKEMENDLQKKEFADKYRKLLRNEPAPVSETASKPAPSRSRTLSSNGPEEQEAKPAKKAKGGEGCALGVIKEEEGDGNDGDDNVFEEEQHQEESPSNNQKAEQASSKMKRASITSMRSHTSQNNRRSSRSSNSNTARRPETCPNASGFDESSLAMNEIIPSLEDLLDQLHNIKPNQFYENQRKLKLYDIQLMGEELESRKSDLFKAVDAIKNWDKKETAEEEEERKRKEEEAAKPAKRKTSFMRTVLRNFSLELMMKTVQYGWTDVGQCRYLRNRGGDDDTSTGGVNTLATDTMKIKIDATSHEEPDEAPRAPAREPGFDENGKMIRTADLLGLKYDSED